MEKLTVRYDAPDGRYLPPRRVRVEVPGWGGAGDQKMEDGGEVQPWHCLPFVEGSTYGLELVYPHEQPCVVVNEGGVVRFEWAFEKEAAGGGVTGGEFVTFFPKERPGHYFFNTRLDVAAPAGHVLRVEPHPRFFTDMSGEVPAAVVANVQTEWWTKALFVVFKSPPVAGRHVFRKGQAFAQVIFVPQRASYEVERMGAEEAATRRKLAEDVELARANVSTNRWKNKAGVEQTNHYKVMAAAFGRGGMRAVEEVVAAAVRRHEAGRAATTPRTVAECMREGTLRMAAHKYEEAWDLFVQALRQEPSNAEAVMNVGVCEVCLGGMVPGLETMRAAIEMRPASAGFRARMGEVQRLLGRLEEAEGALREAMKLEPRNAAVLGELGLVVAMRGRADEGLKLCEEAVGMGARVGMTWVRRGEVLALRGEVTGARESFERALAAEPGLEAARERLAGLK